MSRVLYPGSFDPIHNGHIEIVEAAVKVIAKHGFEAASLRDIAKEVGIEAVFCPTVTRDTGWPNAAVSASSRITSSVAPVSARASPRNSITCVAKRRARLRSWSDNMIACPVCASCARCRSTRHVLREQRGDGDALALAAR